MSHISFRQALLASTVIAGMTVAAPAFAQDAQPTNPPPGSSSVPAPSDESSPEAGIQSQESAGPAEESSSGDIVVTGTLIKNPNLVSSSPVTAIGQEEINLRQSNVAEQILRDVPGTVASVGQQTNNGNGGQSFVDLRGLGINRNIVLLDGTRIVPGNLAGVVDLNNVPLALVERVDVLTGGASTTYGADAISGVVNFITRKDFGGMELNVSQQITERGDGNQFRGDFTVGANFDDNRGNAVISVGYQDADPVFQGDRDFSAFALNSFTGNPQGSNLATTPTRFSALGTLGARQISADGTTLGAPFVAFNFNPANLFQTPFKRFNMYGAGHYEVADGLEVYAQGLMSKNKVETILASTGTFGTAFEIPFSNPFINPAQRTVLCTAFALTAAECAAAATATNPTDPNFRSFTTPVNRRLVEIGTRDTEYTTNIFNYRAGLRGDITDTIGFDVYGAYGESTNQNKVTGQALKSRVQQALLATNQTTCLTATNGCVPLNLFGPAGSITPEQASFLSATASGQTFTELAQIRGIVNGDLGFTSPFAVEPIGFAAGAEYRNYKGGTSSDLLTQTPGEILGSGAANPDSEGRYNVYEAFAELIAPLVADVPFFHSLTLEAGIRRSRYTVFSEDRNKFKTTTYKVGGSWEPIPSLKIRGNYNRAVRAPNIGELFSPVVTGLTNLANDPCAGAQTPAQVTPTNPLNPNLASASFRDVCLAQGAPAARIGLIGNPNEAAAGQINQFGGGNPLLGPEKANTYTIGAVFQPDFFRNFVVTVDYYNIKVRDAISAPTPSDAINACFPAGNVGGASATNPACTAIRRNPFTGELFGDPAVTQGIPQLGSNLGRLLTDGVDLTANYRTNLPFAEAKLNLSFAGNYTRRSKFQATPTSENRECTGFFSTNCGSIQPKYSFNQRTTLTFGDVDLSLLWRYIHKVRYEPLAALENGDAFEGNSPTTQSTIPGSPPPGFFGDQNFNRIRSHNLFDLSGRFNVSDNFDMTVTVTNVFDKDPPLVGFNIGPTGSNSGNTYPATYDPLGRRFAVGARVKF